MFSFSCLDTNSEGQFPGEFRQWFSLLSIKYPLFLPPKIADFLSFVQTESNIFQYQWININVENVLLLGAMANQPRDRFCISETI